MIGITYDGYNLQDSGVYTTNTNVYSAPPRTIQASVLANKDGSKIVNTRYEPKTFTCEGYLKTETIETLDALIDDLKSALNKQNQYFEIDYNGGTRRYIATPRNIIISRDRGLNTAGWSCEFYCEDPMGWATETASLLDTTAVSGSLSNLPITVDGSYKAEPEITVTVTSVTGATSQTLSITNETTLRGISITRTWANGDVLEIDSLNKTVYINGAAIDFSGQFPVWDVGLGGITYSDTFTTRSVNISATYTKRYL